MTRDEILEHVIRVEGGYVNNPNDAGGETNFGVTQNVLDRYAEGKSVKNLTMDEAKWIYLQEFWLPMKLDMLLGHPKIQLCLFDQGVNRGPGSAIKQVQETLKLIGVVIKIDSKMGPQTAAFLSSCDEDEFCKLYLRQSLHFYIDLCKRRPSQLEFLSGWVNRLFNLIDAIEAM